MTIHLQGTRFCGSREFQIWEHANGLWMRLVCWLAQEGLMQVPPLRYASVGMTIRLQGTRFCGSREFQIWEYANGLWMRLVCWLAKARYMQVPPLRSG
jgi:hypothetical protein